MTLLRHLVQCDVRRFARLMAAYAVVAALSTLLDLADPRLVVTSEDRLIAWSLARSLMWLAYHVLAIVVGVLVVQAHVLVGSDAFWMTRPIAARLLLASKIILLAVLLVVLPLLLEAFFMAAYGVPLSAMIRAALQLATVLSLWTMVLMSGASVTRSLGGFGLLAGGAIAVLAVVMAVSLAIAAARFDGGSGPMAVAINVPPDLSGGTPLAPDIMDPTSGFVFLLLATLAGLAMLAVQYRWRLPSRSVVTGAAGLAAAFGLTALWPAAFLQPRLDVPAWARAEGALQLSIDPASVTFDADAPVGMRNPEWRLGRGLVSVSGVEPGWLPRLRLAAAVLNLDSGAEIGSRKAGYSSQLRFESEDAPPNHVVLNHLLEVDRMGGLEGYPAERGVVMIVREPDFRAHVGAAGAYTGSFFVDLTRLDIAATLPLRPGSSFRDSADWIVLDEVRTSDAGASIRLRRSGLRTMFDRRGPQTFEFYLRNRALREASTISARPAHVPAFGFLGLLGAVAHGGPGERTSGFHAAAWLLSRQRLPSREKMEIDDLWLRDAELVIVRSTREGSVLRTLTIPRMVVGKREGR